MVSNKEAATYFLVTGFSLFRERYSSTAALSIKFLQTFAYLPADDDRGNVMLKVSRKSLIQTEKKIFVYSLHNNFIYKHFSLI